MTTHTSTPDTAGNGHKPRKHILQEYLEAMVIAVVVALVIRTFMLQAFRIPTGSMEDTLLVGDFLLVNKMVYGPRLPFVDARIPGWRDPEPGDVVVFKYPRDPSQDYIKRCIATGGQTVKIRGKTVYVDNHPVDMPTDGKFIDTHVKPVGYREPDIVPPGAGNRDHFGPVTVPEGHLFVMGDNRDNSLDSRYWGFLPRENIVGEALLIYFSWDAYVPLYRIGEKIRWNRLAQIIR
jgi:signal peptidase I